MGLSFGVPLLWLFISNTNSIQTGAAEADVRNITASLLRPDGTVDASVRELGATFDKKAVIHWTTDEAGVSQPEEFALIPFSKSVWYDNGHPPTVAHGCPRWVAELYSRDPVLMGRIHSGYHENSPRLKVTRRVAAVSAPVSASPAWPTGFCPLQKRSR